VSVCIFVITHITIGVRAVRRGLIICIGIKFPDNEGTTINDYTYK
jgi:hypothetical protein